MTDTPHSGIPWEKPPPAALMITPGQERMLRKAQRSKATHMQRTSPPILDDRDYLSYPELYATFYRVDPNPFPRFNLFRRGARNHPPA